MTASSLTHNNLFQAHPWYNIKTFKAFNDSTWVGFSKSLYKSKYIYKHKWQAIQTKENICRTIYTFLTTSPTNVLEVY